jgi:acetyl-CoA carboxylase beta subunit
VGVRSKEEEEEKKRKEKKRKKRREEKGKTWGRAPRKTSTPFLACPSCAIYKNELIQSSPVQSKCGPSRDLTAPQTHTHTVARDSRTSVLTLTCPSDQNSGTISPQQ